MENSLGTVINDFVLAHASLIMRGVLLKLSNILSSVYAIFPRFYFLNHLTPRGGHDPRGIWRSKIHHCYHHRNVGDDDDDEVHDTDDTVITTIDVIMTNDSQSHDDEEEEEVDENDAFIPMMMVITIIIIIIAINNRPQLCSSTMVKCMSHITPSSRVL